MFAILSAKGHTWPVRPSVHPPFVIKLVLHFVHLASNSRNSSSVEEEDLALDTMATEYAPFLARVFGDEWKWGEVAGEGGGGGGGGE